MGRLASSAFDLGWISPSPEGVAVSSTAQGPGRLPGNGRSFRIAGLTTNVNPGTTGWTVRHFDNVGRSRYFVRFYLKLEALPGASGMRIFGAVGATEGTDDSLIVQVDSSGTLSFYSKGNGPKRLLGTSATALTLNRWYRINITVQFNTTADVGIVNGCGVGITQTLAFGGAINATIRDVDLGTDVWTSAIMATGRQGAYCPPATPIAANGIDFIQTSVTVRFGPISNAAQLETDGGACLIDDYSADDTLPPGAGSVTMAVPIGGGFYQGFSGSNDWRSVAQVPPSQSAATPSAVTNTTPGAKITFAYPSLRSLGITGFVKAINLAIYGTCARSSARLLYRRNSADVQAGIVFGTPSTRFLEDATSSLNASAGWYVPIASGSPDDVYEIGFIDGPSGAGTTSLACAYLMVDHETPEPATQLVTPSGDLQIYFGRYTGNGGVQDIALPFTPTFLIIKPDSGAGTVWADGFGPNGQFGTVSSGTLTRDHAIARVYTNGFTVYENTGAHINQTGIVARFIAISDPARRMIDSGTLQPNPASTSAAANDNFDVPLHVSTFAIEALFTWAQSNAAQTQPKAFMRTTGHSGDAATPIDQSIGADVADAIQSIGTGTFQLGKAGVTATNLANVVWLALRSIGVFNNTTSLLQVGSYLGDGAASRVINFATPLAAPGLVLVFAAAAAGAEHGYRWADVPDTSCYAWLAGLLRGPTVGPITAFAASSFTVANQVGLKLNVAATRYHYVAFSAAATDPFEAPFTDNSTIGLAWVEFIDQASALHVWAKIALPDPATYYGGYKEDRVIAWGLIQRALSDRLGVYESADFSWECSDTDRAIRALLAATSTQYFLNRPIVVRMISDADRRLLKTPITVFKGIVRGYEPTGGLKFSFDAQDIFSDKFNSQAEQDQIPQRTITAADFPNAPTEPNDNFPSVPVPIGRPVPIIYGEVTDTQLVAGLVATTSQLVFDSSIPAPHLDSIQRVAGTGAINDPVAIYAAITCIKNGKEGPFSNVGILKARQTGAPATFGIRVNFPKVADVDSYRIYFADAGDVVPYKTNGHATRLLFVTHDNTTVDGFNPPDYQVTLTDPASATDLIGGSAAALADAGLGQVPLIYVGDYALPDSSSSALTTVTVAPSPAISGTSLTVGNAGANAPAVPFFAYVYPTATIPLPANAEWVQVTANAAGVFTIVRAQRGSSARTIVVGDQIAWGNPAALWRKFLVCGHAVKDITEAYASNKPIGIKGTYWTDHTGAGMTFTAPADFGFPNWIDLVIPFTPSWAAMFGATAPPFEDINGNRYTVIYAKANDEGADRAAGFAQVETAGAIPAGLSVKGIESVGDSTGTLISDSILQYRHCLQNWIFGSYRSGIWLASPLFEDDASLAKINDASFDAASAIAHERMAGGYVGAGIIGWSAFNGSSLEGGERLTVKDLVARWNLSTDCDSGFNRKGQFFVSMENESGAVLTSARALSDVLEIVKDSLRIVDKFDEHFNDHPYEHTQDYFNRDTRGWGFVAAAGSADSVKDAESIARFGGRAKTAQMIPFYFIRGHNKANDYSGYTAGTLTAIDIMGRRLRRMKNPPRYATFKIGLQALNFELGDVIKLTHFEGVGANGWINEGLRVVRFVISIDDFNVEITGYDLQLLYAIDSFILGDESVLPASWGSASTAQRLYGYLGDETAGTFSTGDPIKRLG